MNRRDANQRWACALRSARVAWRSSTVAVALLGSVVGCSTEPVEPEITNEPENFEFQIRSVANFSTTLEYTWRNTGTTANVTQSSQITAGSVTLTGRDANGTQVYSRSLSENGKFTTSAGASGNWRIQVVPSNASGTLNFRVQRGG